MGSHLAPAAAGAVNEGAAGRKAVQEEVREETEALAGGENEWHAGADVVVACSREQSQ